MATKTKFPLNLPPRPERKVSSDAQDLAFGRMELESAIRFLRDVAPTETSRLCDVLATLPAATVHHLGCRECNGDVPLHEADLMEDRLCRPRADVYDQAIAERKAAMRAARTALKVAA